MKCKYIQVTLDGSKSDLSKLLNYHELVPYLFFFLFLFT